MLQVGHELTIGEIRRARTAQGLRDHRDGTSPTMVFEVTRIPCCGVLRQVELSILELGGEPVFLDVYLIQIFRDPRMHAVIAYIADFNGAGRGELTLEAHRPGLHIGLADVRVHRFAGFIGEGEGGFRHRALKACGCQAERRLRATQGKGPRLIGSGDPGSVRVQIEILIEVEAVIRSVLPEVLAALGVVFQRKAGADHALAIAKQLAYPGVGPDRVIRNADLRFGIDPGGVVGLRASNECRVLIAGQQTWTEQIADARRTPERRDTWTGVRAVAILRIADHVPAQSVVRRQ